MASTTESVEQKKLMLRVSEAVYRQLRQHGEETYPHECCGVLLGKALDGINEVEAAIRAGNTRTDSAHNRYHIAPQELISIQRQARERRTWTSSVSTTLIPTIRRAGHKLISTKPTGSAAPTSSPAWKRV